MPDGLSRRGGETAGQRALAEAVREDGGVTGLFNLFRGEGAEAAAEKYTDLLEAAADPELAAQRVEEQAAREEAEGIAAPDRWYLEAAADPTLPEGASPHDVGALALAQAIYRTAFPQQGPNPGQIA